MCACHVYPSFCKDSILQKNQLTNTIQNNTIAKRSAGKCFKPNGVLAQLGEHLPYKQRVTGSSPVGPIAGLHYMAR